MGNFPNVGEKLGQEITFLGLFWEVAVSQHLLNGFSLEKTKCFLLYPNFGKKL